MRRHPLSPARLSMASSPVSVERARRVVWRPLVLAVEDDPVTAHLVRAVLDRLGFFHGMATSREETARFLSAWPVDALILDVDLPDGTGLELMEEVRSRPWDPQPPILVCSGMSDRGTVEKAVDGGADDFLRKPVDVEELSLRMRGLLARAPRPWEPGEDVMRRLGVTSGEYLDILRNAGSALETTRHQLEAGSSPELLDSLVVRSRGLAEAVGNRALARSLDRLTRSWPERDAVELAALLRREAVRVQLLLDASRGASRDIPVPPPDPFPEDADGPCPEPDADAAPGDPAPAGAPEPDAVLAAGPALDTEAAPDHAR